MLAQLVALALTWFAALFGGTLGFLAAAWLFDRLTGLVTPDRV